MVEIKAILVFEMLGRPADHLKLSLEDYMNRLSEEKDIEIINKKIHEPKKVEEEDLFTTFSEVEIKFKNINELFRILFVFMPSNMEIITPEELRLKNFELTPMINETVRKLHQYDEITRRVLVERDILRNQLKKQGITPEKFKLPKKPDEKKKN